MESRLPAVIRRPEAAADSAFRLALFAQSHGEAFAGLDAPLRDLLLAQQCAGQSAGHGAAHPRALREIVECDGAPVGRIVIDMAADALVLVDIALLPSWRGRGIGAGLIAAAMAQAREAGLPLRLSVALTNAGAMRLYRRLGFVVTAADAVMAAMEWGEPSVRPNGAPRRGRVRALPDRLRLPLAFDPAPMAAECAALARAEWIAHFVTSNYEGDWSVIPLRGKAGATHPVTMIHSDPACRDFSDTPFLAACPAIRAALAAFACPLDAVRLMRLGPGAVIKEHVDHDLAFEQGAVRFHIPIATHPEVDFRLNGDRVVMEAGSAWYLRLSDPHGVANRGESDRIHLVIDARVTPWVEALFADALARAA